MCEPGLSPRQSPSVLPHHRRHRRNRGRGHHRGRLPDQSRRLEHGKSELIAELLKAELR